MERGDEIIVRNPYSIRPYQHVLEPVCAYLMVAQRQYEDASLQGNYNIGPDNCDCVTTGTLADLFCKYWGEEAHWINLSPEGAPHEAGLLKLDCARIQRVMNWRPVWHIDDAVKKVVEWSKVYLRHGNLAEEMDRQIDAYIGKDK